MAALISALLGCAKMDQSRYAQWEPKADLRSYFSGPIKAWGLVQDRSGNVLRRFDVDMVGTWSGDEGTLEEEFRYYDGEKQYRTWKIQRLEDGSYTGTAGDIIGQARGRVVGGSMHWLYEMNVPVGSSTYRLSFDDWMWLMNDGVLINRSYMKKFGITVAELTVFMQKQQASGHEEK